MEAFLIIIISIGLVLGAYLLRFLLHKAINKGSDAIHNARTEKQNAQNASRSENLADRYRQ